MQDSRMPGAMRESLRCPICRNRLNMADEQFVCANPECETCFPVVDGIPVLINEKTSIFSLSDYVSQPTADSTPAQIKAKDALFRWLPSIDRNMKGKQNYARLSELLFALSPAPRVLVVGGRILGQGMEPLAHTSGLELIETDVSFGPRTMLICDAHDIPFADETFDGVIVQAVMEHVVDPYRCADEIHRVVKHQGLVYAETPFMQQVHAGRYDFTRFTHLGHRRLFRKFDEIDSGAVGGPGMAMAWSYQYFLRSFTTSKAARALALAVARLTAFTWKYFDYYLIDKAGTLDAASGCYFLGRKGGHTLSDRELITLYRGSSMSAQDPL